jgi:hypothetical protein
MINSFVLVRYIFIDRSLLCFGFGCANCKTVSLHFHRPVMSALFASDVHGFFASILRDYVKPTVRVARTALRLIRHRFRVRERQQIALDGNEHHDAANQHKRCVQQFQKWCRSRKHLDCTQQTRKRHECERQINVRKNQLAFVPFAKSKAANARCERRI